MDAFEAIETRRSLRQLDMRAVPQELIERLLYAGSLAPAPHHTKPWRFVTIAAGEARARLADAMGDAWRGDLEDDGVAQERVDTLLARSRRQIEDAPALVLACLVPEGLRSWPDERRRRAEWGMAQQSMGCALENIMLAAHAEGLACYWISAPLFCGREVRTSLDLPREYEPQAFVVVGYPQPGVEPRSRAGPDLGNLIQTR